MTHRFDSMRAVAILAVCGALTLAGCGGGHSSSTLLPGPASAGQNNSGGSGTTAQAPSKTTGTMSIIGLPAKVTSTASRARLASSTSRSPQYFDTTTPNSAVVVSVTPQDPAESSQYGNLTVCYNLYTNGTIAPNNPPSFVVAAGPPQTVTVAFPAPPGTVGFQVTQYAGQCGATPYTIPVPPAGVTNGGILSQTPVYFANLVAGAANNVNAEIANCTQPATPPSSGSGFNCAVPGVVPPTSNLVASIAVANIAYGPIPISSPVREQGAFLVPGTNRIGVPIPLEGLNAAGTVVPGLTTSPNNLNLNGGAGPFPSGVSVALTENVGGTVGAPATAKLSLVDAVNGTIAQGPATTITIHEFNALSDGSIPGVPADNTSGDPAGGGHPWVLILTYDGSGAAKVTSEIVTSTATIPPATTPTTITTTISPQSAVYTAVSPAGTIGYFDQAAPATPVGLLQTTVGGPVYVTDGSTLKIDGTGTVSAPAVGTKLGALAFTTWGASNTYVYAVDQGQTGNYTLPWPPAPTALAAAPVPSGLYAFNPVTLASTPVAVSAGTGGYVQFANPVGVVESTGPSGRNFLYVIDKSGAIFEVDMVGNDTNAPPNAASGFQLASMGSAPKSVTGTPLSPGSAVYLGTLGLSSGKVLVGDPGNNRIAQLDTGTNTTVGITAYATGAPLTGLYSTTGAAPLYATSTTGQIYYLAAAGGTPVSLGFATGTTAVDGPIGQIPSLTPATAQTFAATNYKLQFQTGSFFTTAPATVTLPYTLQPFAATPPATSVFTVVPTVPLNLAADTSSGSTTGPGTINATAGIVFFPSSSAASAVVTPGSFLFTDSGTKLRTAVQ